MERPSSPASTSTSIRHVAKRGIRIVIFGDGSWKSSDGSKGQAESPKAAIKDSVKALFGKQEPEQKDK